MSLPLGKQKKKKKKRVKEVQLSTVKVQRMLYGLMLKPGEDYRWRMDNSTASWSVTSPLQIQTAKDIFENFRPSETKEQVKCS